MRLEKSRANALHNPVFFNALRTGHSQYEYNQVVRFYRGAP
jgi:hypothetical protein